MTIRVKKSADPAVMAGVVEVQVGRDGEAELVALGSDASQVAVSALGMAAMNLFNAAMRLQVAGFGDSDDLPSLTASLSPYIPEDIQTAGAPPHGLRIVVRRPSGPEPPGRRPDGSKGKG